MKVLITGANGQVGQHLVKLLSSQFDVTACDKVQCDITDWHRVEETFRNVSPDVVINAAAYTAVDLAEEQIERAYLVNEQGSLNLAKAANQANTLLVHLSTDYVFSGESTAAYNETDETAPEGVYGASKRAGEQAVLQHHNQSIVIRTAWVFSEFGSNFVKTMLRVGQQRDELGVVADQFGSPTYAGDIAKFINKILVQYRAGKSIEFGTFHYSGVPHVSWHQFAEAIFDQAVVQGLLVKKPALNALTTEQYLTKAVRPKNSRLDCMKARHHFQMAPSDWQHALENLKHYVDKA